jgi:hypothetical protein
MGTSTNATLVYGYHFGSGESPELHECDETEANEYGYFKASWWDAENEEPCGDDNDLFDVMMHRLFDSLEAPEVEYGWERADVVKERMGVWFESHCSGEYPMWVLCTAEFTAYRGDAKLVDVARLAADPVEKGWDAKLAEALRILDVHPRQESPGWLLVSYWG